jgi:tetratricopeptide (TPR) repeat protein
MFLDYHSTMPNREDVYQRAMNEGHSAAWDQDWRKAAASYRQAIQEFPDQPRALNSLGLALYQLGEFEEALRTYQRVAALSPNDPLALEKVAQISERLGDLRTAVEAAMHAADIFINQREVEKALENWSRVTALNPEHALAHSRLALVHERLGHNPQAVTEYLALASILQRSGKADKAQELVAKSLQLAPNSTEARQALALLKTGQILPKPIRVKGGTGPIAMAKVRQLQEPSPASASQLDPVAEARQKAMTSLAEILFDYTDSSPSAQERRGLSAIMKGTGQLSLQQAEQTKIVLHLGQAIDAQSRNQEAAAAEELDHAAEAGFKHPALYFDLGYLRARGDRLESAVRNLAHAVKHNDFSLGARLLLGDILLKKAQLRDAALEFLQALQIADALTVPQERADDMRQLYEPLIEAQQGQKNEDTNRRICENIRALLMRPDWRDQIHRTRENMPHGDDSTPVPLAEVMLHAQSSGVIESMNRIHQLARAGSLRSAMDEAFDAVQHAPTYLPLHSLMGDLLIKEGREQDAIAKFSVVAHAYGVRGEVNQATKLLRRIIQLAPMDLSARMRLIDQLVARGQVDDAINEYLELGEIYYRLAELDMARKTYTTALRVVQQTNADRTWNVHILQRMADIDMQRLDWKQAVRVYEQIRTLRPDDQGARRQLLELYMRMGQEPQAIAELDSFLTYLDTSHHLELAVPFLEDLVKEHPDHLLYRRTLAAQLHRAGRTAEAVSQLDSLGEALLQAGKPKEAVDIITQILLMDPPNASAYRQLLAQLEKGAGLQAA